MSTRHASFHPLSPYAAFARRAVVGLFRQPSSVVPTIVFPLMFLAMSSAALESSTRLPGFPPVESFLQFLISTTVVQGALFGSIQAGSGMAIDIEGGFFERMVATPVPRSSILVGRVGGAAVIGFIQAWLYLGIALAFGTTIHGGLFTIAAISIVAMTLSAGIGAVAVAFALRTGSSEAVQGAFPMLFATLFLSSAFFPRNLMEGWFRSAASLNPLSHMIEGLRAQVIAGPDLSAYLTALGVAAGVFVFGLSLSSLALRGRLKRSA
jgi:ABC-2 type transport system permease protein